MAELESLAQDETLEVHLRRHRIDRLIMLCDGVFAIAATLAAIEISIPRGTQTLTDVFAAAGNMLMTYVVSFAVIAIFWTSNRELFARVQRVDRMLTVLVLAMLCGIALIPGANRALYTGHGPVLGAFRFYALLMTLTGACSAAAWIYAVLRPGMLRPGEPRGERIIRATNACFMPLIFLAVLLLPSPNALTTLGPVVVVLLIARRLAMPMIRRRLNVRS